MDIKLIKRKLDFMDKLIHEVGIHEHRLHESRIYDLTKLSELYKQRTELENKFNKAMGWQFES